MVLVRVPGMSALSSSLHRVIADASSKAELEGTGETSYFHKDHVSGMRGNNKMLVGNSTTNLLKLAMLVKKRENGMTACKI